MPGSREQRALGARASRPLGADDPYEARVRTRQCRGHAVPGRTGAGRRDSVTPADDTASAGCTGRRTPLPAGFCSVRRDGWLCPAAEVTPAGTKRPFLERGSRYPAGDGTSRGSCGERGMTLCAGCVRMKAQSGHLRERAGDRERDCGGTGAPTGGPRSIPFDRLAPRGTPRADPRLRGRWRSFRAACARCPGRDPQGFEVGAGRRIGFQPPA